MDSHSIHVMTIANSIIGVSIIAMPYCFKQCGIILSIIMLIFSSIISRLSCHFLLKSAIRARLRTFEFLAYHAFGSLGKFVVEIGMIGFLLGTCIAFFVVMGDLGPEIVAEMIGIKNTNTLRSGILISLAIFCVLPLGLLRNVDSLNATYAMLHDGGAHFIPETKFRTITIFIILISLIIGILIPNIELVLGLVGSTIGVSICVLFPATCFICMVKKNTNERILAQMMLFIGIVVMVLGTYANVNAVDDITLGSVTQQSDLKPPVVDLHKPEDQILAQIQTTGKFYSILFAFYKFITRFKILNYSVHIICSISLM
ncbi:amino acid transporter [Holotrichia oblita]|uniref:Amino acid transporter n=1 Tax=Holotrichia oblita TaxID=644536 RepID=A0ACB9TTV7_HOLOL|nr:amino acid transporter [Holotrichia oblita]